MSSRKSPHEKLKKYVEDDHNRLYQMFGTTLQGDQYNQFNVYLNKVLDNMYYKHYVDSDETAEYIDQYMLIFYEKNNTAKGVALSILHSYYDTIRMKTLKQLFRLESFKRLTHLTGEDQEEIYAQCSKEREIQHQQLKPKPKPNLTPYKEAIYDIYLDDVEPGGVSIDVIARFLRREHPEGVEYIEELYDHYQTQMERKKRKKPTPPKPAHMKV